MQIAQEMHTQAIKLPEGVVLRDFRPVAYYDKHMDFIRVVTHDRSVTEHRVNEFFTVHQINNPGPFDPKYAGFTIKGVRSMFEDAGLALDRTYKLADLIDTLVKHKPGSMMSLTLSLIFDHHRGQGDLNVEMMAA